MHVVKVSEGMRRICSPRLNRLSSPISWRPASVQPATPVLRPG